jgi:uncharacterized membrane protein required for colicin V production
MFFDIVFILYTLANIFLGIRFGLFRRAIHVGAFYLGMLLAQALSPGFSEQFGYNTGPNPASAHFGVYLVIVVAMVGVAEILGFAYADALAFLNTMLGDRAFGAALGLIASVLEIAVLIYLFGQLVDTKLPLGGGQAAIISSSEDQLKASLLTRQMKKTQGVALIVFRPVLPPEPGTYFAKTYTP